MRVALFDSTVNVSKFQVLLVHKSSIEKAQGSLPPFQWEKISSAGMLIFELLFILATNKTGYAFEVESIAGKILAFSQPKKLVATSNVWLIF